MWTNQNIIALFGKCPTPGEVKTRIGQQIGDEKACHIYTVLLKHQIDVAIQSGIETVLFYGGTDIEALKKIVPPTLNLIPQEGKNLGERMKNGFNSCFRNGAQKVILIGSDIPEVTPLIIKNAVNDLDDNGAVIGPAEDGGYYMIGFNRSAFHPSFFEDIVWSQPDVLKETVAKFKLRQILYKYSVRLSDMDTVHELQRFIQRNELKVCRSLVKILDK